MPNFYNRSEIAGKLGLSISSFYRYLKKIPINIGKGLISEEAFDKIEAAFKKFFEEQIKNKLPPPNNLIAV